jgi:hypothetical protein
MRRGVELINVMTNEAQQIVYWMIENMKKQGGTLPQWYVGVATDPKTRLFTDHSVNQDYGHWMYSNQCSTSDVAREVEQYFLSQGAKGGTGGGDNTTKYVYA